MVVGDVVGAAVGEGVGGAVCVVFTNRWWEWRLSEGLSGCVGNAVGVVVGWAVGPRSSLGEIILPVLARPTTHYLPRGAPPDLNRYLGIEMLVDGRGAGKPTSSRNSFGECAKNGEGVGVRSTIRAPDHRLVFDVLAFQCGEVRAIKRQLALMHGFDAVNARMQRVG